MATAPSFFDKAVVARARLSVAETSFDGTGANVVTPTWIGSGGAGAPVTDWVLKRVEVVTNGNAADSLVNVFLTDGADANPRLIRSIDLGDPPATSATVGGTDFIENFGSDYQLPAGCGLRFSVTVTPTAGAVEVFAFCERA
jgi:hypothetical protein